MMLFENRNITNTFYIKKKNRKKYTDVGENFNILSHKYYEFKPHHFYLHHVSASDHLLELPQVPIKPVYLLVLLVQHHYLLGQAR